MNLINQYVKKIAQTYKTGHATEHSYRGDLESLLKAICPKDISVINEPKRAEFGAPDFIINKGAINIGYIEAKDIGKDLNDKSYKEQFSRYKSSLSNIIFTDYMDFHFYRDGKFVARAKIAGIENNKIVAAPQEFNTFENLISAFTNYAGVNIKSPDKLSKIMAGKARLMANVLEKSLLNDVKENINSSIKQQHKAFQRILIENITEKEFADVYAQTIAYGMFAARLHDNTPENFSRQKAGDLIPKANPFLRKLFQYIAGYDLDERLIWIVDSLAEVFRLVDINAILNNFGKFTQQNDPMIHFYETFLAEYDPTLRKSRGVWYTPEPVVRFIVRTLDQILKDDFNLPDGLADTSKIKIQREYYDSYSKAKNKIKNIDDEVHRVQILDPATGTGTFLAEVIKQVYGKFKGMQGMWSSYVEENLIPRLNGFELLMASYAMAHLKLELLLKETNFQSKKNDRLRIYLTNSLEEHSAFSDNIFATWLSDEACEASNIKRYAPVMVVLGNPPYNVSSSNKGEWMDKLMLDYKQEPTGERLQEKNFKMINDDYVKFIRYAQYFIEKNGEGVLAYINNHSWLDNPTFRGMRYNLLKTFDKIYVIDLHGNAKKKEVSPDGSKDENVFDIQVGVSINIFIKTGKKSSLELAKVYHKDLWGLRSSKYQILDNNELKDINFTEIPLAAPSYLFIPKDYTFLDEYQKGFAINELFSINSAGIKTSRDKFTIHNTKEKVKSTINEFLSLDDENARNRFKLDKYLIGAIRKDLIDSKIDLNRITPIAYRPFDIRYTYYTGKTSGFHERPRNNVMKNIISDGNVGIVVGRQGRVVGSMLWNLIFVAQNIIDNNIYYRGGGVLFPLYLYPNEGWEVSERVPNLNMEIVNALAQKTGLTFTNEKSEDESTFAPIDILDYIYAVLHSPNYREQYKEFLKSDFPRLPYPKDKDYFYKMVEFGNKLRQLHLLKDSQISNYITEYPVAGNNQITRKIVKKDFEIIDQNKKLGRVWINDTQYFDKIPLIAWDFYIGGYQPAQKYLKDRSGLELRYEDIVHYQQIIVALAETCKIMSEIDSVGQ